MSDPFIAEIVMFAGTFAPRGWAFCEGQLLPIAQNQALFSLLGTTFGGDGRTTFALPDLRGARADSPRFRSRGAACDLGAERRVEQPFSDCQRNAFSHSHGDGAAPLLYE